MAAGHGRALIASQEVLGTPLIYYGDEVGLRGGTDPDCRRCMEWDSARQDRVLLDTHRRLIGARRRHAALRRGTFRTLVAQRGLYGYVREADGDAVVVLLHNGWDPEDVDVSVPRAAGGTLRDVLTDERFPMRAGRLRARLERGAALVLEGEG